MKHLPRLLATALVAASLALAAACSGGGGTAKPSVSGAAADNRTVKNGGTLTMALAADPDALDPSTSTTLIGREVFTSLCEKLYDIDANSKIVPQLASGAADDVRRTARRPRSSCAAG